MTLIDALISVLLGFGIGVLAIICALGLLIFVVLAKGFYDEYIGGSK